MPLFLWYSVSSDGNNGAPGRNQTTVAPRQCKVPSFHPRSHVTLRHTAMAMFRHDNGVEHSDKTVPTKTNSTFSRLETKQNKTKKLRRGATPTKSISFSRCEIVQG